MIIKVPSHSPKTDGFFVEYQFVNNCVNKKALKGNVGYVIISLALKYY